MSNVVRSALSALAVASLLATLPLTAAAQPASRNLVDVEWLAKNLSNPAVLVLDASPAQMFAAQHVPGAISVDIMLYGVDLSNVEMERRFQSWGVSPGKKVVVYDQGGTFLATRTMFSLEYYGFPVNDLAVLDGGLAKWREARLPVTSDPSRPEKGTFQIKQTTEAVRVRLPEFLNGSGDTTNHALVEALGPDWHFGEVAPFGRPGHPPNGVLWPAADLFNPDKTFKSPAELRKMADYLRIRPDEAVYTYCGGGIAASAPYFALKFLLGYPNVKLYQESELGYLADERQLPYWTYDAPTLLRDTPWLQAWNGQMIRMYTRAPLSVVDVRPAEAYAQGHVPFSVNVPADTFKAQVASPRGVAALLGPAGVDPAHEVVIVSGAGLTKDAALAFAMLDKLGQKKVSVFVDSLERATQAGYPVTKAPTIVGPRKSPKDFAVPPAIYGDHLRDGVMVFDAKSTHGPYPKVFVASGAGLPSKAVDGSVVHLPYTDLLTADGAPKPAKDLWNVLSTAGISRYAELVCVSDDPGEAAIDYFVLKLMGFPDVKILVN